MAEAPELLRAQLAEALCTLAGLTPERTDECVAQARGDASFVESMVDALVTVGVYRPDPEQPLGPAVRTDAIESLPCGPELIDALDLRRAQTNSSLEQVRLARVYALAGSTEKAASCFRAVVALDEPLSLALTMDVAEAAATGGRPAIAMAAIDWIAECLLTRDDISEGPRSDDPVRRDPLEMGALLARAAHVALSIGAEPRTVALAKAAGNLFERLGRAEETRACLLLAAKALHSSGQTKKAMAAAKRLREQARTDACPSDEAYALRVVAERLTASGAPKQAIPIHQDAAKLLTKAGLFDDAALAHQRAAKLLHDSGQLERAQLLLAEAATAAEEAGAQAAMLRLQYSAALVDLDLGRVAAVLTQGAELRKGWEDLNDSDGTAQAVLLLARALVLAGDSERARKALARCRIDGWKLGGRSLRVRAELALLEGRPPEARMLLLDAARALLEAGDTEPVGEALLRRAELSLDQDDPDACRVDLKRCRTRVGSLGKRLELRGEILRARLCSDLDEREILLEEAHGRATTQGLLFDRTLSAAAKAQHHLQAGEPEMAQETLTPVLAELVRIRGALPETLREGFRQSPLIKRLLELSADPTLTK